MAADSVVHPPCISTAILNLKQRFFIDSLSGIGDKHRDVRNHIRRIHQGKGCFQETIAVDTDRALLEVETRRIPIEICDDLVEGRFEVGIGLSAKRIRCASVEERVNGAVGVEGDVVVETDLWRPDGVYNGTPHAFRVVAEHGQCQP